MTLWFLGLIPVGVLSLSCIEHIQKADRWDFLCGGAKRWLLPWRYWFWPSSPGPQPHAGLYEIRTRHGLRIWIRLRSGLHYQLREYSHRARTGLT